MSRLEQMDKAMEEGVYCESCDYFPVHTREYPSSRSAIRALREGGKPVKRRLCEACASTHAGTATEYPEQFPNQIEVLRAIAWSHNRLMDEVRGLA